MALPSSLAAGAKVLPGMAVVQALRDVFFEGNGSAMARSLGELPGQVNFYANGEFAAPLHFFLRASHHTGATMEEMFVTHCFTDRSPGQGREPYQLRRAMPRRVREQAEIERMLTDALAEHPPRSVRAIAIDLNMEPVTLWRRSPDLCSQVSKRNSAHVAAIAAASRSAFEANVRVVLAEFKRRGRHPSEPELRGALQDPGCFLNVWKRSVIRAEMTKIEW
jgi:hypothetical protein